MDIFDIHNVKTEKANAMLQYHRFKNIATLFRLVELFSAVVLFSWISTRLPFVIRTFNDYFRQLLSVAVSPLFIFLIGNVIILTLVLKSGQINNNQSDADNAGTELYEAIANNVREEEEIVYEDKRIVSEVNAKPIRDYCCKQNKNENEISQSTKIPSRNSVSDPDLKIYRRSQSENLMKKSCSLEPDELRVKLKRSETELRRREAESPAVYDVVDELSNEDFQKRIEGFIARQIRFHQEEKVAIVTNN